MENLLLLFVPISVACNYLLGHDSLWLFFSAGLAIVPLASWIRKGTEHLAHHLGSAIGGLLNITFGNLAELILAFFLLAEGKGEVVKAQITGAIIGNGLLGLGLGILVGSWGRKKQTFRRENAGQLGSMLILAVIALLVPAVFDLTERDIYRSPDTHQLDLHMSVGVSIVLICVYCLNLVYTLVTHHDVFAADDGVGEADHEHWSIAKSLGVLVLASAVVALESEYVSGALEGAASALKVSSFFLGITVIAIAGNAAEYVAAIYFARKNQMGLVVGITVGATIQIALLVAPLLVLTSLLTEHPMNLVFHNPLELVAVVGTVFAVNSIAHDGETTWFEGALLVAVYAILAIAFLYVTP
ncbi:MAG: calcium/proton exchanger [Bdellovibrionota bacterium]